MTIRENVDLFRQRETISKGQSIEKLDTGKIKLTEDQQAELEDMTGFKQRSAIESQRKQMKKSLKEMQGSYAQVYDSVSAISSRSEFYYSYYILWDALLFMLTGMAFYK